jgi:hypothetical protein
MPVVQYGICDSSHYTKIKRVRVDWSTCRKCLQKEEELAKRRRYLEAKNRKEQKEIPTFIRNEFDRFGKKIKKDIRSELVDEIREEIRDEVRNEIRAELELDMNERVKWQVENTINRILNSGADYPLVPSPPSPPSSMFSQSD